MQVNMTIFKYLYKNAIWVKARKLYYFFFVQDWSYQIIKKRVIEKQIEWNNCNLFGRYHTYKIFGTMHCIQLNEKGIRDSHQSHHRQKKVYKISGIIHCFSRSLCHDFGFFPLLMKHCRDFLLIELWTNNRIWKRRGRRNAPSEDTEATKEEESAAEASEESVAAESFQHSGNKQQQRQGRGLCDKNYGM